MFDYSGDSSYLVGMDAAAHLLPQDDTSLRVGKIVLASARLEFEARLFALHISARPKSPSLRALRNGIVQAAKPHPEAAAIEAWIDKAFTLWDERNKLAHSVWLDVYDDEDPTLHALVSAREFHVLDTEAAHLNDLLRRILDATLEGLEISNTKLEEALASAPAWGGPFGMPDPWALPAGN